jgi:hypothetical protein
VGPVLIGADIGQKRDPSAIAVAELEQRGGEEYHVVRHLERLPLGTPYPAVAARLRAVTEGVRARMARDEEERILEQRGGCPPLDSNAVPTPTVYMDATGVGQPVVDLLKGAGVPVRPVFFTHGDRRVEQRDGTVSLGKAWLVSRLQALLQTGRILLPRTSEADALARELQDFEIKVDQNANEKYGAFRVGSHDDLVTALGLAVQPAPRPVEPLDPAIAGLLSNWRP